MVILIAVVLALIPAVAVLYPFLRQRNEVWVFDDETSPHAELTRRWESMVTGLRNTELERALGTLTEEDFLLIRERYLDDAAMLMKSMDLEEQQESDILAGIEDEVQEVRSRFLGSDDSLKTGVAIDIFLGILFNCDVYLSHSR